MTNNQIWFLLVLLLSPIWLVLGTIIIVGLAAIVDSTCVLFYNNVYLPIKKKLRR